MVRTVRSDETVCFISSDRPQFVFPAPKVYTPTRGRNRGRHVKRGAITSETDSTLGSATKGGGYLVVFQRATTTQTDTEGIVAVQTEAAKSHVRVQFTAVHSIRSAATDKNEINVRAVADPDPPPLESQHGPYRTRFTFAPNLEVQDAKHSNV